MRSIRHPGENHAGVDWSGKNLRGADLRGANLREANLSGADLSRALLEGADLTGANMQKAKLGLAILGGASLAGANLDEADLSRANLVGTYARGASARRAKFYYARPGNAVFAEVDFTDADINRAIFRAADLRGAQMNQCHGRPNLDRALLEGDPNENARSWSPPFSQPAPTTPISKMIFHAFVIPEVNETNVYFIACPETRQAALIDAGGYCEEVDATIRAHGLKFGAIIITHNHYDHTDGLEAYCRRHPQARVMAGSRSVNSRAEIIRNGQELKIGSLTAHVADTSGHTADSISIRFDGVVFTGDALFAGSIGGTTSETLRQQEIQNIREKILSLPDSTELYSGHGPGSTVYIEKTYNPFLI